MNRSANSQNRTGWPEPASVAFVVTGEHIEGGRGKEADADHDRHHFVARISSWAKSALRIDIYLRRTERLAEFERSLIRERTQAGLAAARRAGRTGGRPPKLTDDDIEAAKAMLANPDIGVTQIAHRLGVSPATLYRYIPAARTANTPGV
jgi:hypothetical protein